MVLCRLSLVCNPLSRLSSVLLLLLLQRRMRLQALLRRPGEVRPRAVCRWLCLLRRSLSLFTPCVFCCRALKEEFGDDLEMSAIADPGTTGNFEVVLEGELIHSKSTMGHGKCTTAEEVQKIIDQCQEVIDSK